MTAADRPTLARLREALADGRCLCSSASTDWRGVEDLLDEVESLRGVVAAVEGLARSEQADRFRDEAARGVAQMPYASNRYLRLLDDLRAALDGTQSGEGR